MGDMAKQAQSSTRTQTRIIRSDSILFFESRQEKKNGRKEDDTTAHMWAVGGVTTIAVAAAVRVVEWNEIGRLIRERIPGLPVEDPLLRVRRFVRRRVRVAVFTPNDSTDVVFQRLVWWFEEHPPENDDLMAELSLLQQQTEREGNEDSFCAVTVYAAAIQSFHRPPPPLRKARTMPS